MKHMKDIICLSPIEIFAVCECRSSTVDRVVPSMASSHSKSNVQGGIRDEVLLIEPNVTERSTCLNDDINMLQ